MKSGLEALAMCLLLFLPFIGLWGIGQPIYAFIFGVVIALGSFVSALWATAQHDIQTRKQTKRKGKAKDGR